MNFLEKFFSGFCNRPERVVSGKVVQPDDAVLIKRVGDDFVCCDVDSDFICEVSYLSRRFIDSNDGLVEEELHRCRIVFRLKE